jgi:hypothetical protein
MFDDDDRDSTPDSWDDQSITSTLALLDTPSCSQHSSSKHSQRRSSPSPESYKSKHGSRKWTPKKISLLCNMWEQEPHLYDGNLKEYRNKQMRIDSLDCFAAILNMDYEDVKTRMKSLRTVYKKLLQAKPTGSRAEPLTTGQRNILEMCAFLKPYLQTRPAHSNLPPLQCRTTSQQLQDDDEEMDEGDNIVQTKPTKKKDAKGAKKKTMVISRLWQKFLNA